MHVILPLSASESENCPSHLDGAVGVSDDCDKKAEDHVDEEWYKAVEVDPAEDPNKAALLLHVIKGGKHVVPVDQREQTLRHRVQRPKLQPKKERVNYYLQIPKPQKNYQCRQVVCLFVFSHYCPSNLFMIRTNNDPAAKTVA